MNTSKCQYSDVFSVEIPTVRSECLGWAKYRVEEMPELTQEVEAFVEAFLDRYHYQRPHLAFTPMRPPLTRG